MATQHEPTDKPIELMAPEVDDILSKPPQGLLRWGSGWVVSFLALLVAGSYFVRFPEYVEGTATITTARPPLWLTARVTSRIKELHADHLSLVKQGQLIAVLENPALESHVLAIRERLNDSTLFNPDGLLSSPELFQTALQLGDIQPYWSAAAGRFTDYYLSVRLDNTATRISSLKRELTLLQSNRSILERRLGNQQRSNELQRNRLERDKELLEKGVLSMEAYQESEQSWLAGLEAEEDCRIAIGESTLSMTQIQQTLKDEASGQTQRQVDKRQAYLSAVKEVKAAVDRWAQTYLLISPVDGRLTYPAPRSQHQQVVAGEGLFAIVPLNSEHLKAILRYPAQNSGKVKVGQTVRIYLDGYPHLEYGTISATIRSTALMPGSDSNFTAIAHLPYRLSTNYGKQIEMKGELSGKARIDTRKYRLIERLFNPLRYLFASQKPKN